MAKIDFQPEEAQAALDFQPQLGAGAQPSYAGVYHPTSLLGRTAADVMAGLGKMGYGLMAAPSRIAGSMANLGLISPETAGKVPTPAPEIDYGRALGIEKPNIGDVLLQNIAQASPYIAAGGATIPGQMATGALFGATQTPSPIAGAGVGAATGGLFGAAGNVISKGLPMLGKVMSKYAAPGLVKTIKSNLDELKDVNSAIAFDKASSNYNKYQDAENQAWENLQQQTPMVDMSPDVKYDDSSYVKNLNEQLKGYKKQAVQSEWREANPDLIDRVEAWKADPHNSFTQAFQHNQALNEGFRREVTPGKSPPFAAIKQAKGALLDNIQQNLDKNNLNDSLGMAWKGANQATANKNRLFNETITPAGKAVPSTFIKYYKGDPNYGDPTNFVKQYLPTSSAEGTQKMQQFSNMVGDEEYAKDVLKSNYFDKTYNEAGINPKSFLSKFNSLSQPQRDYLFSADQQNTIRALNKILTDNPDALDKPGIFNFGWYHSLPGLIGLGIGHEFGHPLAGAAIGLTGTNLVRAALQKAFENQGFQRTVINNAVTPASKSLFRRMLGNVLGSRPTIGAALPTAMTPLTNQGQ